jgi:hypothetical protein
MTIAALWKRPDYDSDPLVAFPDVARRAAQEKFGDQKIVILPGTAVSWAREWGRGIGLLALGLAVAAVTGSLAEAWKLWALAAAGVLLIAGLVLAGVARKPYGWPPSRLVDTTRMVAYALSIAALIGFAAAHHFGTGEIVLAAVAATVALAALVCAVLDVYFLGYVSWWWFPEGMMTTAGNGRVDRCFRWPDVDTMRYVATEVSLPDLGTYRTFRFERYELTIAAAEPLVIDLSGGGGPVVLGDRDRGHPHILSEPLAESVTTAQTVRFGDLVAAGETVHFGPYSVAPAGLVSGNDVTIHWSRVRDVYLAYRSDEVFYNQYAEKVTRRCYIAVEIIAPAGEDEPRVWGASTVPDWPGIGDPIGGDPQLGVRLTSLAEDVPNLGALRALIHRYANQLTA